MTVALLIMADGRTDHLLHTLFALDAHLQGRISKRWIHDDTGSVEYRAMLQRKLPEYQIIDGGERRGFGGAIRSAWCHLLDHSQASHILHIEDDMVINRKVDLRHLTAVLDTHPHLVQMAFRRQAWNETEIEAGGVVETNPDAYDDRTDGTHHWLEHRQFFTTNASIYRRSLIETYDWPTGPQSEGRFTHQVFADHPNWKSGYWGSQDSEPLVTHIGARRVGTGY